MKNLSSINESQDIVNKKYVDELAETKVDKVDGKGLSTNDYTTEEKEKLNSLENYTLPMASKDALGGVKVGSNLLIDDNGVLSAIGGEGATEVSVGTEEPTDPSVVVWVDTTEEENIVSLINQTGLYDETFQYKVNDMIMYNEAWYLCREPVAGISPNEDLGFEDPYWYPVGGGKTKGFTILEASTDNVIDFNTLTEPGIYLIKIGEAGSVLNIYTTLNNCTIILAVTGTTTRTMQKIYYYAGSPSEYYRYYDTTSSSWTEWEVIKTTAGSISAGTLETGMSCATPTSGTHIANKSYVDNKTWNANDVTTGTFPTGISCGTPTANTHIVNKQYVDNAISSAISTSITSALGASY